LFLLLGAFQEYFFQEYCPAGRPGTGPTRWLDQSGFVKRPAGATTQQNPVDPAGQPMTRANPDETRRFGGGSLDMIAGRSGFGDLEGWRWVPFLLSGLTIDDCNMKKIEG
jgi:hypothetical protein